MSEKRVCGVEHCTRHYPVGIGWKYERIFNISDGQNIRNLDDNEIEDSTDPEHYHLEIEPWDFIHANKLSFAEGNVIKYICRWREKGGVEDLKKAKQYIDMLIGKEKHRGSK